MDGPHQRPADTPTATPADAIADALLPRDFSAAVGSAANDVYLADLFIHRLAEFFEAKGLQALKDEDRAEQWYADWLAYQAKHRLYAGLLSPRQYSSFGTEFDLLRYARFLEVFAYFSPAHGYSLQVSFLGLFSILMGSNAALKREAVTMLEAGGLLAFAVSEKTHGSDLLANGFVVTETAPGRLVANGSKYYIGNSNSAAMISVVARREGAGAGSKRAPFVFFSLRPSASPAFRDVRKIRTLGVRAAHVGELEVKGHAFPATDVSSSGRGAWDAVFGTVTLGKFFLGFGSIGMCEHALAEAVAHLQARVIYGKPAIDMPHIRSAMVQAYARLAAMKMYAYLALDYVHAAREDDRRYLLFTAVQKAKVSTEGVKVMSLLAECMGARAFESDTYFEMALRDVQLIPGLEGSMHINLGLAAKFIPRYFARPDPALGGPPSLVAEGKPAAENPYLMEAQTGGLNKVAFADFLAAYSPCAAAPNVRAFVKQVKAFRLFVAAARSTRVPVADLDIALAFGQGIATIAYGQLVAEAATASSMPAELVNVIFHSLVNDFSAAALTLASSPKLGRLSRVLLRRLIAIPQTTAAEWDAVAARMSPAAVTPTETPGTK